MIEFKVALFDLDGTLIDTEGQYSEFWTRMGEMYCPEIPDFAKKIKGTTLVDIFARYFHESLHAEIEAQLNDFEAQMDYPLLPGADEIVRNFKAHGVKCAVVTSSAKQKVDVLWKKQRAFLELFDKILMAEDFSASKPNPDCYLKGMAWFGASTDDSIVFEDAPNGLAAGMASGCFTVGLATENPAEVIAPLCHHVLPNFVGLDYEYFDKALKAHKSRLFADEKD